VAVEFRCKTGVVAIHQDKLVVGSGSGSTVYRFPDIKDATPGKVWLFGHDYWVEVHMNGQPDVTIYFLSENEANDFHAALKKEL
jgi:hypothetical protein